MNNKRVNLRETIRGFDMSRNAIYQFIYTYISSLLKKLDYNRPFKFLEIAVAEYI